MFDPLPTTTQKKEDKPKLVVYLEPNQAKKRILRPKSAKNGKTRNKPFWQRGVEETKIVAETSDVVWIEDLGLRIDIPRDLNTFFSEYSSEGVVDQTPFSNPKTEQNIHQSYQNRSELVSRTGQTASEPSKIRIDHY